MSMAFYHPFRSKKAKERYLKFYDEKAAQWPVQGEDRMIDTSYGRTFVRAHCSAGTMPLVLLPGGSATSLMWWPNIEALSQYFDVYAVDSLYDFGRSVYSRKPRKPEDITGWLSELFDALHLEKINIMGLSMGGWMASQVALHFPERVRKMVLVAPANTVLMLRPQFAIRALLTLIPLHFFTRSFIYWLFESLVKKNETGKKLADDMAEEMYFSFRCFRRMPVVTPTVLSDSDLQNFKVPTLFLVGENEKIYSAREAVRRVGHLARQWNTEIIPSAGHDLTFSQADRVDQEVIEFLTQP